MRPLDPRLLRRSRAARGFLAVGAGLAGLQAGAIVAFAWALAALVVGFIDGGHAIDAVPGGVSTLVAVLLTAATVRALAGWSWEWLGSAGAMRGPMSCGATHSAANVRPDAWKWPPRCPIRAISDW